MMMMLLLAALLLTNYLQLFLSCPYAGCSKDNNYHGPDHISKRSNIVADDSKKYSDALLSPPYAPFCFKTNGSLPTYSKFSATVDAIKNDYYSQLPVDDESDLSDALAQSLRLSFHDAGEADVTSADTLGPDGCISNVSDSNGLLEPTSYVTTLLEPIWQTYCDGISRADFWALIGKLATEYAEPTQFIKIPYQYGRIDNSECESGAGRLPNGQLGLDEYNRVFVKQMGLSLKDGGE